MALFGKGPQSSSNKSQPSSGFGAKPSSIPQKPFSPKPAVQKPVYSKPVPAKPQKPAPQKPQTFFGEKKDWRRQDFISRVAKNPLSIGGKGYSSYERKKILDKTFSPSRFSTYISEREAKTRLRELRREEYRAKTGAEKSKISQTRKYIEKQTGLQGKY
jgi:hypothetical protein